MRRSENGSALPLALLVLLLVSVLGVTLFSLGMTEVAVGTNWRAYSSAFYSAEAGVESGVVALRQLLAANPEPTKQDLTNISTPPAFLTTNKITFTKFTITRPLEELDPGKPLSSYAVPTTLTTPPYAGLFGLATDFAVTVQVTGEGGTKANLTQIVRSVEIPLSQYGVFYGKGVDLEIAPGKPMTFNGRVHANSDIYMGPERHDALFDSYVTSAGGIYRRIKRDAAIPYGANPQIKDANGVYKDLDFDSEYQPGFTSKWKSPQDWAAKAQSTFGPGGKDSTVKDKTMGVVEILPPVNALFQPKNPGDPGYEPPDVIAHKMIEMPQAGDSKELQSAKLYSQAGLRIIDGVATDQNGNAVTLPGAALKTTTFYDAREQKTMTVYEIDIAKLQQVAGGKTEPANGILYVAGTGPNSAVRLVNGSSLPPDGLTVVSQNPVYVKGNYNTAATGPDGNHPPAAVVADAITVLSGSWDDNKQKGPGITLNKVADANTTVNAAFATGPSAESSLGKGNGQLENDIRFLEDWTSKNFTFSGSILSLWHSQQATAPWICCNYYKPPNRIWSYDKLFDLKKPPGTALNPVITVRGRWIQQ